MSKAECNRAYLRHKQATEAALRIPKVSKVKAIFKRKPYSSTNYSEVKSERKSVQMDGKM